MNQLNNPNQELFCQLYASNKEFFGNGVASYVEAYHINLQKKGAYASARSSASDLLTNPNILKRIDELMEIYINNQVVDKELAFVILQKADLSSKVAAIREYNKLKQRIIEKIEHSGELAIDLINKLSDVDTTENNEGDEIPTPPETEGSAE